MELIVDDEIILKTVQLEDVENRYKVIEEKFLYDVLLISCANNKLVIPVCRIALHNMPKYRHTSYFYHRLGFKVRLFRNSRTETACKNYNFHLILPFHFFF